MIRAGLDRQLAADQQGALAHAADAEAALGLLEGEAAAVVGDLELDPVGGAAQGDIDAPRLAVAGGVGQRLLGDPVEDELRVVVEVGEVALGAQLGLQAGAPQPLDLAGDRRGEAEVVERRRPQLAGEREQLAHRLAGQRPGLGDLRLEPRRRRFAHRLEPQQQPGQRLVDLVVQVAGDAGALLLLGAQGGGPGAPALGFEAAQHAQEGELDPLDLLGLADPVDRLRQRRGGPVEVDLLHVLDQLVERREAPSLPQQGRGQRDGRDGENGDGHGRHRARIGAGTHRRIGVRPQYFGGGSNRRQERMR